MMAAEVSFKILISIKCILSSRTITLLDSHSLSLPPLAAKRGQILVSDGPWQQEVYAEGKAKAFRKPWEK